MFCLYSFVIKPLLFVILAAFLDFFIFFSLYCIVIAAVKWMGSVGDWFTVMTGVRQGCILSPLLFALVIDWITRKALTSLDVSLELTNGKRLCDLDYADDIVLLDSSIDRMRKLTEGVEDEGRKVGLCMNAVSYTHLTLPTIYSV